MLITSDTLELIEDTKNSLKQFFKMKDLGELKYFIGIEFTKSKHGILMHERKNSLELIVKVGLERAKPYATAIDTNTKLTTKQYDDHLKATRSKTG